MNFSKKSHFLKNVSRFKVKNKKIMKSTQCIEQVGVRLRKKILWKIRKIEGNIEYLPFLNCYKLFFHK